MQDYLIDLLKSRKKNMVRIKLLETNPNAMADADEVVAVQKLAKDYIWLEACIENLKPQHKDTIECLYLKGYSMHQYGRLRLITKGSVQGRKDRALRELRALFG